MFILKTIMVLFALTIMGSLFAFGHGDIAFGLIMATAPIAMEQKDFDALVDKLGEKAFEKINSLVSDAEKGNKEALTELKRRVDEVSKIDDKPIQVFMKNLQEHANNLEKQLKESKEYEAKGMTIEDQWVKQLTPVHDQLKKAAERKTRDVFDMDLKAAINMSVTDSVGSGVIQPLFLPGITGIAKARPALWELLNKIPWMRDRVYYNQIESETGDPSFRKEAAASLAGSLATDAKYAQRSYKIENKEMKLEKIGVHTKITEEMVENIPDFVSWIQQELVRDVLLTLNSKLYTGTGTAPEFKGLQHSDFYTAAAVPGGYTLPSGVTPNEAQALRAIVTQMINGYFNPTAILMNPTDTMKLDLAVDKNGTPIIHPFAGRDNSAIKGVPIFEMPDIAEGKFHIIDGSRIALYIQRALNIRIFDQVDDDPLYDRKTIVVSVKCAPLVKANEVASNIYGDLSTVIAALTANES